MKTSRSWLDVFRWKANRVRATRSNETFHSKPSDSSIKIVWRERNGTEWNTNGNIGKWQLTILMVCIVCVHDSMRMTHATTKQCEAAIILIWQWHSEMRTNRSQRTPLSNQFHCACEHTFIFRFIVEKIVQAQPHIYVAISNVDAINTVICASLNVIYEHFSCWLSSMQPKNNNNSSRNEADKMEFRLYQNPNIKICKWWKKD